MMETELSIGLLSAPSDGPREYNRSYPYASQSSIASAFGHFEHVAHDNCNTGTRMTRATKYNQYSEAAGSTVLVDRAEVARCTVLGGQAGAVRQHVSDAF